MRTNLILCSLYFLVLALAAAMNSFANYQPTNDRLSSEDVPPVRNVFLLPLGSSCTGTTLPVHQESMRQAFALADSTRLA
jgi:hypothetical protein